jgi:hypothetical protein
MVAHMEVTGRKPLEATPLAFTIRRHLHGHAFQVVARRPGAQGFPRWP